MTYGILIKNSAGRTVIDTSKNESLLYVDRDNRTAASQTATAYWERASVSLYPNTNHTGGAMIIARPKASTSNFARISRKANVPNGVLRWGSNGMPSTITGRGGGATIARELKAQSSANITPSNYGLVAYDTSGNTAAANILFSATDINALAVLVARGNWDGVLTGNGRQPNGFYNEFTMDPTLDQGRYYCLVNTSASWATSGGSPATTSRYNFSYEFDYANGKIRMLNFVAHPPAGTGSFQILNLISGYRETMNWAIFYVKNGGYVDDTFT
jgi:hypothetical protein